MICPRCNSNLAISNTQNVEIDFCPNCRGVWLDRGELEKIIERSNAAFSPFSSRNEHGYSDGHHDNDHDKHYKSHDNHSYGQSRHKKGFLSELFDF